MSNLILQFIIFVSAIALVLLVSVEAGRTSAATLRARRAATAVVLLLLVLGPRWLPAIGIDAQAAVGGSVAIAMGIVIVLMFAEQITRI
jgi:hypothetical protein